MTEESVSSTTADEPTGPRWHTSSYSGASNNCVEHGVLPTGRQAVRDTKDRSQGTLIFEADAWQHFITAVRDGEFNL